MSGRALPPLGERVKGVLAALRKRASKRNVEGMARYGIPSTNALGVSVGDLRKLAKTLGRDHDLAGGLWETGIYEARMLASYVDDPGRVTPAQMDRWCRDFDSWAIVDTVCFHLFDKTPHGFRKPPSGAGAAASSRSAPPSRSSRAWRRTTRKPLTISSESASP